MSYDGWVGDREEYRYLPLVHAVAVTAWLLLFLFDGSTRARAARSGNLPFDWAWLLEFDWASLLFDWARLPVFDWASLSGESTSEKASIG